MHANLRRLKPCLSKQIPSWAKTQIQSQSRAGKGRPFRVMSLAGGSGRSCEHGQLRFCLIQRLRSRKLVKRSRSTIHVLPYHIVHQAFGYKRPCMLRACCPDSLQSFSVYYVRIVQYHCMSSLCESIVCSAEALKVYLARAIMLCGETYDRVVEE